MVKKKIQIILNQLTNREWKMQEVLQVLEDFSLFSKFGKSMLKSLKELNHSLDREELPHKKQSVITSFFSKQ